MTGSARARTGRKTLSGATIWRASYSTGKPVAFMTPLPQEVYIDYGKYDLDNIFNVDETGLFYRLLSRRSYLASEENRKTVRGVTGMKARDCGIAYICSIVDGTA